MGQNNNTQIILLVSEQTIPNVSFLYWYLNVNALEKVSILFVSTEKMEKNNKSKNILNGLTTFSSHIINHEILKVCEDDFEKTVKLLESKIDYTKYSKVVFNITGGTKMMSVATYQCAIKNQDSIVYYLPIGKTLEQIFPQEKNIKDFEDFCKLSLDTYFKSHGIQYEKGNACLKEYSFNKQFYNNVYEPREAQMKALVTLQNQQWIKVKFEQDSKIDFSLIGDDDYLKNQLPALNMTNMIDLFSACGFNEKEITEKQLFYLCGGWFEEFVYQYIINEMNEINPDNVLHGIKICKGNDRNELDIVYLDKHNYFHVIECKSFTDNKKFDLNETLYKLQAICKTKFGLSVKAHLYTLSLIEKNSHLNRAKEFGIAITDGNTLMKYFE